MVSCSVYGCTNQSLKTKGTGIRYYRFPRSNRFKNKWLVLLRRQDQINIKEARVCSNHFREDAYYIPLDRQVASSILTECRQLKDDAVPTEHLPRKWNPETIESCEEGWIRGLEGRERRNDVEDSSPQSPKRPKSCDSSASEQPTRSSQEDDLTGETHYILTLPRQMRRRTRRRHPRHDISTLGLLQEEQHFRSFSSSPADTMSPGPKPNNVELVFGCSEVELRNMNTERAPARDLLTQLQLRPMNCSQSDNTTSGLTVATMPNNVELDASLSNSSLSDDTTPGLTQLQDTTPGREPYPCIPPLGLTDLTVKATRAKVKQTVGSKAKATRNQASNKQRDIIERLKAQNASLKYERDSLLLAREAWRKERKELSKKACCNKTAIVFVSDINAISNMPNYN